MVTEITCHPPLGQTTVVSGDEVQFTICIELDRNATEEVWEATLWHGGIGNDWAELPCKSLTDIADVFLFSPNGATTNQNSIFRYYECTLSKPLHSSQQFFTIKFRVQDQPWQWVKDTLQQQDGEVLFQDYSSIPDSLQSCFSALDQALEVTGVSNLSEQSLVKTWEISDHVPRADDTRCGFSTRVIGKVNSFSRWFALVRHSTPWIAPRQGKDKILLDKDAILCSFLRLDGLHLLLLAVTTGDVLTVLSTNETADLLMVGKNDNFESGQSTVIVALGTNFEDVCAAAVTDAEKVIRRQQLEISTVGNKAATVTANAGADELQGWYDGLTYCTWNALGQNLDQTKIHNALHLLSESGVSVTTLLIDDGWQSLDHPGADQFERGWTDFEAHKEGFPDKLSGLTTAIRQNHPQIQHIGVWHGVFGYWGAMSPDGNLAKKYETKSFAVERDLCDRNSLTAVKGEHASELYTDFYEFLRNSGVDAAKADTRYLLDCLSAPDDRGDMIRRYNSAWLEASANHLSMRVISCMAMIPQLLFSPELIFKDNDHTIQQKLILRNSDDFFPEAESSHLWHIFWNAHNAIFTRHLNAILDWDMFQTTHAYSGFHAAARCVSGGPVCITDHPGQHNLPLLKQLVAKIPNGQSVILRPSVMGRSVQVYSAHNEEQFCKVATLQQVFIEGLKACADIGIMGVFNMSRQKHVEFLPFTEFSNFRTRTTEYALRSFMTGVIIAPPSDTSQQLLIRLELEDKGYDILTLHPLLSLNGNRKIAVLGLLEQMSGAAAIISIDVDAKDAVFTTFLKALGCFGIFLLKREKTKADFKMTARLCGQAFPDEFRTVEKLENGHLLKLDLEGAWKNLALPDQEILVQVRL